MRRYLILPALMISLLLGGCGGAGAEQRKVEELREKAAAAEEITFTADVTANLGSEVFDCTLRCDAGPESVTAEVISPESVAGVRARTENGGITLEFEDVSLGIGSTDPDDPAPLSVPALLVTALRSGFLQRCWTEREESRELIAAEIYATDAAALTVWFDRLDMTPLYCELSRAGEMVFSCEIRDFAMR